MPFLPPCLLNAPQRLLAAIYRHAAAYLLRQIGHTLRPRREARVELTLARRDEVEVAHSADRHEGAAHDDLLRESSHKVHGKRAQQRLRSLHLVVHADEHIGGFQLAGTMGDARDGIDRPAALRGQFDACAEGDAAGFVEYVVATLAQRSIVFEHDMQGCQRRELVRRAHHKGCPHYCIDHIGVAKCDEYAPSLAPLGLRHIATEHHSACGTLGGERRHAACHEDEGHGSSHHFVAKERRTRGQNDAVACQDDGQRGCSTRTGEPKDKATLAASVAEADAREQCGQPFAHAAGGYHGQCQ